MWYDENTTMTACMVGSNSDCEESWNVTVKYCYDYNIVYLQPFHKCGRYCLGKSTNWRKPKMFIVYAFKYVKNSSSCNISKSVTFFVFKHNCVAGL